MPRILIRGIATVFQGDTHVTDTNILRSLNGLVYDEERFTDYLGGPADENALAEVLIPGGVIEFSHSDDADFLTAVTEYRSRRFLTDPELQLLVDYTMGQWSDGIGENWTCSSNSRCGYTIMCVTPPDPSLPEPYPTVEVAADWAE